MPRLICWAGVASMFLGGAGPGATTAPSKPAVAAPSAPAKRAQPAPGRKTSEPSRTQGVAPTQRLNPDLVIRQNPSAAALAQLPAVYAPTRPRTGLTRFPWKTDIVTTVFWIGEPSTGVTAACNTKSSWDTAWEASYGGFDDPDPSARRWDFGPKAFEPNQNPFYIALPFNDVTNREVAPTVIPWFATTPRKTKYDSVLKGRWVAVRLGKKICYAQWEDVGPFETDDWAYVFGRNPQPKTVMNNGVGLDVSPAVRDYLGLVSGVRCDWRFCEIDEVPDGPWRKFGGNNPFVKSRDRQLAERISRLEELQRQRQEWLEKSQSTVLAPR
jgi:hypothetical protein